MTTRTLLTTDVLAIARAYAERVLTAEQAAGLLIPIAPAKNATLPACTHGVRTAALIGDDARPACPLCLIDHGYAVPLASERCTDCRGARGRFLAGQHRLCDACFRTRFAREYKRARKAARP